MKIQSLRRCAAAIMFAGGALLPAPDSALAQRVAPQGVHARASESARPAALLSLGTGVSKGRQWWWIPAGGAVAGAVGLTAFYLSACTTSDDGCMGVGAIPLWGAGLGAVAGGLVELALRAGEAVSRRD